jgi:hypothetical protein
MDQAKKEVQDVILRTDLSSFDTTAEECAVYLYDLACWFGIANEKKVGITDAGQLARRYLAYSLARSLRRWAGVGTDPDLKSICDERDLKSLKEELGKKLEEEPKLATLKDENFTTVINGVLEKIGWCNTWN